MPRSLGPIVGILAVSVASLSACDDSDAKKPASPLPDVDVKLHGHFGRPGATLGLVMRSTALEAQATPLLSEAAGLDPDLMGLADLLQPADLFVIDMAGTRHRVVSFTAVPKLEESLPEGHRLEVEPKARGGRRRVITPDGKTRCISASERLLCSASAPRLGEVAEELQPVVTKWAQDHTDAVVEMKGDFLREVALPAIASDLTIVKERLGARLARGLGTEKTSPRTTAASRVASLGGAPLGPKLATFLSDLERAVFRLRIDGRQARLEARVDFDPAGESGAARATSARQGASPLVSVMGKLPAHAHAMLVDGASGLGDGLFVGALRRRLDASRSEDLDALEGSLAPGYALALTWRGAQVIVVEAQRSEAPERTAEALRALAGSVPASGEEPAITMGALPGSDLAGARRLVMGEQRALMALKDGVLLVASGYGVDDDDLRAALGASRGSSELRGMAAALASQVFGVAVDLQAAPALDPAEHGGEAAVIFGYRVAEKTPASLRGAAVIEARRAGMMALTRLIRDGRAGRPDPVIAPRDVADDGSTEEGR